MAGGGGAKSREKKKMSEECLHVIVEALLAAEIYELLLNCGLKCTPFVLFLFFCFFFVFLECSPVFRCCIFSAVFF